MKKIILLLPILILSGCAQNRLVLMKNPQTGDIRECKRNPLKNWAWEENRVVDACIREYRKAGYAEVK